MGLEEGALQRGLRRRLHGHLHAFVRDVEELLYCLLGVCWPWQSWGAVIEWSEEVVVPHGLCLLHPGLRGFRLVWTVGGPLGSVKRPVEGLQRGALSACGSGGLGTLLLAFWWVSQVFF